MTTETTVAKLEVAEQDFVLKLELGLIFPIKAKGIEGEEGVQHKSEQLANLLTEYINKFDVTPEVMHFVNGEAMPRESFNDLKERARKQAAQMAQMLQAIANEGGEVQPLAPAAEGSAGDDQVVDAVVADAPDGIELGDGAFRVSGNRTLN